MEVKIFKFVILFLFIKFIIADVENDAMDYLKKYGYIKKNPGSQAILSPQAFSKALKKFQAFNGLRKTGVLDSKTSKLMNTPRCGMEDKVANFVTRGKWQKSHLTYKIFRYPSSSLSRSQVDAETRRAFNMWQEVSGLSFSEKSSGPVDIEIIFARGEHGDGNYFDGRGGVLAHAYFPGQGTISGDAHFDDAELWSITPNVGTQVLNTLTHEFGHSLGLSHSNVPGAIMAPYYKGWDVNLRLSNDDIQGIQSLYGRSGSNPVPPVTDSPGNPPRTDKRLCRSKIDSFVQTSRGKTYVFSGSQYYGLTDQGVANGYPRSISQGWSGLPTNIDAAVTWRNRGRTYFFKGNQYWRFDGESPSPGYPRSISNWEGLPSNIDAAFQWGKNGHIYFFKGSNYWKFDTNTKEMSSGYPRKTSTWSGIPSQIDAALQWDNGKTYFFKGSKYWKFNDATTSVNQGYPRSTGKWWFNCSGQGGNFQNH